MNYPSIAGASFSWFFDGVPMGFSGNSVSVSTYSMATGTHQIIVNVMSPDSCYGNDTMNIEVHSVPNVNIVASGALCAGTPNMLVANSTSTNLADSLEQW
ncbi:MAG: hypothetical protein R2852_07145 [Bacteroidia bacterium]